MEDKKFFKVTCKCGHTGSRKTYIPKTFPIKASNAKEAAQIARWIPRCKHHHKDCIIEVKQCSYEDYIELKKMNKEDPYFSCSCIQEQKLLGIDYLFLEDPHYKERYDSELNYKRDICENYYYGKKKIKHPKQYMKNIYYNQSRIMEAD